MSSGYKASYSGAKQATEPFGLRHTVRVARWLMRKHVGIRTRFVPGFAIFNIKINTRFFRGSCVAFTIVRVSRGCSKISDLLSEGSYKWQYARVAIADPNLNRKKREFYLTGRAIFIIEVENPNEGYTDCLRYRDLPLPLGFKFVIAVKISFFLWWELNQNIRRIFAVLY